MDGVGLGGLLVAAASIAAFDVRLAGLLIGLGMMALAGLVESSRARRGDR